MEIGNVVRSPIEVRCKASAENKFAGASLASQNTSGQVLVGR